MGWDYSLDLVERLEGEPDIVYVVFNHLNGRPFKKMRYYFVDRAVFACGEAACAELVQKRPSADQVVIQEIVNSIMWEVFAGNDFWVSISVNSKCVYDELNEILAHLKKHLV